MSTSGLLGLWRCHFGRFVVTNQCSVCSNLHFLDLFRIFCVFPRRFEHGRFLCKGGLDMAGIVPTTFAVSCNRPAAQPSLFSFSTLSLLSPPFLPFSHVFDFSIFSHFYLYPSLFSLFSSFLICFLSFTSSHFLRFPAFFGQSDASPCDHLASSVHHTVRPGNRLG